MSSGVYSRVTRSFTLHDKINLVNLADLLVTKPNLNQINQNQNETLKSE